MLLSSGMIGATLAAGELPDWIYTTLNVIKVVIGFSIIIFVHELGHFLAAKWVGIRVDRFSVGFGTRLFGYRKGEGLTFGNRPDYKADELAEKNYGETDYCFKVLPVGGYVKMLGQDDIVIDDKTGEVSLSDDPRAFTSRPVSHRMVVVSAGVIFNVLFAALLLMAVFLVGKQMPAPEIGVVSPDSPARGLVLPGDRVLEMNGRKVDSFLDIRIGAALADGPVSLKIERDGKVLEDEIVVETTQVGGSDLRTIDADPVVDTVCLMDGDPVGGLPNLLKGDKITHVDDQPVRTGLDILAIYNLSGGKILKLTVRRPVRRNPDRFEVVECYQRPVLGVAASDFPDELEGSPVDNQHILGLRRRRVVGQAVPGAPADEAGFQRGDIIAVWGGVPNPIYQEIIDSIQANVDKPIPVTVERSGKDVNLTVTPKRPFKLFRESDAKVGLEFSSRGEENSPVVTDVAPDTPFAALNMPRGALLLAIDGRPVANWFEVVEALLASAGRTVEVRYRSGEDELSGPVEIPGSIVNELGLPPGAIVWSVDGVKTVKLETRSGRRVEMLLQSNPRALRALLEQKIEQTVRVRYSATLTDDVVEADFTVREDNTDPWQMRLSYVFDPLMFGPKMIPVSAGGNPFRAMVMGTNYVHYQLWQVYRFLTKLADRSMSTENVAGPVGIIKMAVEQAEVGLPELLFFLAFLSVNLAVINFLPMPVMDGGLMLFLLIEKIKGKPLSLKTQMISTMVGLATIILIGLYVTIQDIGRFFSG